MAEYTSYIIMDTKKEEPKNLEGITTIRVKRKTHFFLDKYRLKGESFDQTLRKLIKFYREKHE